MIIETIQDEVGVEVGETSDDGLFTLNTVACIGCCSLAPVIMVNEDTFGSLTPTSSRKLVKKIVRKSKAESGTPAEATPKT